MNDHEYLMTFKCKHCPGEVYWDNSQNGGWKHIAKPKNPHEAEPLDD